MSIWSRIVNVFRGDSLSRDIDEELESHLAEAVEHGRNPEEARKAFGSALRHREQSRDVRLLTWLDSLRADMIFGWRQLKKRKATSAAAILSMALAIGACTAAFRLIDAMLLRPLPVAGADRMYLVAREGVDPIGSMRISESSEYPLFRRMRAAMKDQGELIAVSYANRVDLTYGSDDQMEKAHRQFVSGWMFNVFGLRPAAGRLFTERDDLTPGTPAYAVLSHEYWTRRFAADPKAIGRTFRSGNDLYEIIGVAPEGFTGTEPGAFIDVFVPTMMNPSVTRSDSSWFRSLAVLKPEVSPEAVRSKLDPLLRAFQEERARGWSSQTKLFISRFLNQRLVLEPAASGASGMQRSYRLSLWVLGVLVVLVLTIACANVANLLTAQASARAREIALRVSIGAGRLRLTQAVLVESSLLGILAALLGGLFAWWAAPFVVSMIASPENPTRLLLPVDWRVMAFGLAAAIAVTFLIGLAPALRASSVRPAAALKGGENPHSRQRLMHVLIAVQVAFCFVVQMAAGLFVATSERLANQSTGFSSDRLLAVETTAKRPQTQAVWDEIGAKLRETPGVEAVASSGWPLLSGNGWNGFIWVDGKATEALSYFLSVSPGWIDAMRIPVIAGRDFRPNEIYPGVAIINQAMVKQCFGGRNPIGLWFEKETGDGVSRDRFQVIGLVQDARYRNMREPIAPTAYVPYRPSDSGTGATRTFLVRSTGSDPLALSSSLRQQVSSTRPELRVSNIRTQLSLIRQHTVRERLLATLAVFFATVAMLLAGVGLYGVLDYSVLQRKREIGIRIAIGASARDIARRVTVDGLWMVLAGGAAGLLLGRIGVRYVESLLYGVKSNEPSILAAPAAVILAVTLVAALPAVVRALRVDPILLLRSE
ncbi:MAG TPA: ABC transporter permease [Bryobacteraceae bacterium]|nr:ABC transporter permease [Bryobacteraceae bacterium]